MNYKLLYGIIGLLEKFEQQSVSGSDVSDFEEWVCQNANKSKGECVEPNWEGKLAGRSPESVINTLIVHMNRYARSYSKSAIAGSEFSTQEEFIYLINLRAFGAMSKMQLIKKNVQEKPVGMQIINRLLKQGWVEQTESKSDKRSKVLSITYKGELVLDQQMHKIRAASKMVTGDLTHAEKMELIRLLNKLDHFHNPIYIRNLSPEEMLDTVILKQA
jgi:DNA-binding MarR family transcriptional regulator